MKLAIVVLVSLLAVASAIPWVPVGRPEKAGWMDRHRGFVENTLNNNGSIRVLFYGDSITDWWNREVFDEYYAPLGTANYGISGDRTENLIWRMQDGEISDNLNPQVCVIKIGTNNLDTDDDTAIAMGIVFNVYELRERLPNMKILLLGVLPRTDEATTRRTSNINEMIKYLDNGNTVRFLDMKDHFYRGGNDFVMEYYTDMLHLTPAGYRKWAEIMDPLFREMLSS